MVTFVKRRGKVVGMNMTFAEMRYTYKMLTGKKLADDKFQECGAELMRDYTEQQIRDVVESFTEEKRQAFINSQLDI